MLRFSGLLLLAFLFGCETQSEEGLAYERPGEPYIVVLGVAQDGGFPQIGSTHDLAEAAWVDANKSRSVSSILLVDPRSNEQWLFDATPDLPTQAREASQHRDGKSAKGRPPLFDGIFLTHAHMGHYSGLLHLGREAYGAEGQPVYGSERMGGFLSDNAPWSALIDSEFISYSALVPDDELRMSDSIGVTPFLVPHRDEYSDTFGYRIRAGESSAIFIPDIDKWEKWSKPLTELVAENDILLLDATFFADGEIPGRSMADIPHPFVQETMALLDGLSSELKSRVHFIHFNHTNPLLDPESEASDLVRSEGFKVARQGEIIRF